MTSSMKLGGFKILKGLAQFSLILPRGSKDLPAKLCRGIAQKKINLPYFTCIRTGDLWCLCMMVEMVDGLRISLLIEEHFGNIFNHAPESVVLSLFPHQKNPEITGRLFDVFSVGGVQPGALANSSSAISVVIREEDLHAIGAALFQPFQFSTYNSLGDWDSAQRGYEQLYKEVVASYQEQRPKVYGLEYHTDQELLVVTVMDRRITRMGSAFKEFAQLGLHLTFAAMGSYQEEGNMILAFCLRESTDMEYIKIVDRAIQGTTIDRITPVSIFSMNGPHFGDRYGIVSELLTAFEENRINLFGLSCTVASITGVVSSPQMNFTIETIQECFDVPVVLER